MTNNGGPPVPVLPAGKITLMGTLDHSVGPTVNEGDFTTNFPFSPAFIKHSLTSSLHWAFSLRLEMDSAAPHEHLCYVCCAYTAALFLRYYCPQISQYCSTFTLESNCCIFWLHLLFLSLKNIFLAINYVRCNALSIAS